MALFVPSIKIATLSQRSSKSLMNFLSNVAAQVLKVLPRQSVSRAFGALADYEWPTPLGRAVLAAYCRKYNVTFEECIASSGWPSFDAFFTRELRPGMRPVDADPSVIVSPADGRIDSMARVERGGQYIVKGSAYSVTELLGDEAEARRYEGGGACVVYLSPRDYHRVHAPVAGHIAYVRSIAGDYYPVNDFGLHHVPNLFARNRRVVIGIDTPPELGLGRVTVVMVAAIIVGRVTVEGVDERDVSEGLHQIDKPVFVEKGGEIGQFHLGSTVVMFIESKAFGRWLMPDGAVRYGEAIAHRGAER